MSNPHGIHYDEPQRIQQQTEALDLWMSGASYTDIADTLGISRSTAWSRVQQAIDGMRPHADYDRYRGVQLAEIEVSRRLLRRKILAADVGQGTFADACQAIDRLIRLQEREARLLGLDRVPTPFDELNNLSADELEALVSDWADEFAADMDRHTREADQ